MSDFKKIGKPVGVLILLNLTEGREYIPIDKVRQELKNIGEILEILTVHGGDFNLIAKVRLADLNTVTPFLENIRNIEGIEEVSCAIISQDLK